MSQEDTSFRKSRPAVMGRVAAAAAGLGWPGQVQEVAEEDGSIALGTATAEAESPTEAVAVGAAALPEEALLTGGTFVDRLGREPPPTSQILP